MMQKILPMALFVCLIMGQDRAQAGWTSMSQGLPEPDIRVVQADARDVNTIFAASESRLFRTKNGGGNWRQVLGLRGRQALIRSISVDSSNPKIVYAGTSRGAYRSLDGGEHWELFYKGLGETAGDVYFVKADPLNSEYLWMGTAEGLVRWNGPAGRFERIDAFPSKNARALYLPRRFRSFILAAAADGIYRGTPDGSRWEKVWSRREPSADKADFGGTDAVENRDGEATSYTEIIYVSSMKAYVAAGPEGILAGSEDGFSWNRMDGQNLPFSRVRALAADSGTFFAATENGIFEWDEAARAFRERYAGLDSKNAHSLWYHSASDTLLAGTSRGVFRLNYPSFGGQGERGQEWIHLKVRDLLESFRYEPTVREVQNAAVAYAEVHPAKIAEWRRKAALKALLPKISLDYGLSRDETVDLDRGGTNDPDVYIIGPEESSRDWSVDVEWDLSDLIWNESQTSIDVRSKLMVELRDDILTQVTHLYYERRRLQIELELTSASDPAVIIEKNIRLQELTAGIDALTDGYFSKQLNQTEIV